MRRTLLALFLSYSLTGCSVFMAASSQEAPDLSVLYPGTEQATVNQALGRPFKTLNTGTGYKSTYQYFTGDAANYRRAATYAVLDGITLGLAELITFPAEAVQGDRHVVTVTFDRKRRVLSSAIESHEAPIAPPERLVGLSHTLRPNDTGKFEVGEPEAIQVTGPRQIAFDHSPQKEEDSLPGFLTLPPASNP